MRVARLRNPDSARNRGRAAMPVPEGAADLAPRTPEALEAALARLAAQGCDLLVVDGGDGTLREVVRRLPEAFGDAPPALSVLAHGNTNLVARHVGRLEGAARLRALVEGAPPRRRRLSPLRVERPEGPPLRGFILGWGAYEAATRIAAEEIGGLGGAQALRALLVTLRRALRGREAAAIRAGVPGRFAADGRTWRERPALIGVATTLQGPLLLGIDPFWGEGEGRLRWLDIAAPGAPLGPGAACVLAGRPMAWMARAGYASGRAETLELEAPALVVDGERFETGPGPLRIAAEPELTFLS